MSNTHKMHSKNSSDLDFYYRGTYWISSVFVYMPTIKVWQHDFLTKLLYTYPSHACLRHSPSLELPKSLQKTVRAETVNLLIIQILLFSSVLLLPLLRPKYLYRLYSFPNTGIKEYLIPSLPK